MSVVPGRIVSLWSSIVLGQCTVFMWLHLIPEEKEKSGTWRPEILVATRFFPCSQSIQSVSHLASEMTWCSIVLKIQGFSLARGPKLLSIKIILLILKGDHFQRRLWKRSCFASFQLCVYKFSSHYLNNIIFYRQQFGDSSQRITLYKQRRTASGFSHKCASITSSDSWSY